MCKCLITWYIIVVVQSPTCVLLSVIPWTAKLQVYNCTELNLNLFKVVCTLLETKPWFQFPFTNVHCLGEYFSIKKEYHPV